MKMDILEALGRGRNKLVDERQRREKRANDNAPTPSEKDAGAIYRKIVGERPTVDFMEPDYFPVEQHRRAVLERIRAKPSVLPALKLYYKNNIADFIEDWGYTTDPRNVELDLPAKVPFLLFPKQREWIDFLIRKWRDQEPGLTEKSRDCGISWLAVSAGCALCLHFSGVNIGYGSRKKEYVDEIGSPKSLFWKARKFMDNLPPEFNGGWGAGDAPLMRLHFRETESSMMGEAGDEIGRGDRASIYFVDEAAFLERPKLVEASLSQTTNCRQDISSVNGMANPFAMKRHAGKIEVFVFDWRDDPRKDDAWYQHQVDTLDEVVVAQEIDRNYSASVEGILIPSAWVRAAIDAHKKLGIEVTGGRGAALDVADTGQDTNALIGMHGILVEFLEEWTGKQSDIFATTERAFKLCDANDYQNLRYDADGLGAGCRGDGRVLNEKRRARQIHMIPFRGSAKVYRPDSQDMKGVKNKDEFANMKAQAWWRLRGLFKNTFRAVTQGGEYDPDAIISISSECHDYLKLVSQLSQPTWGKNGVGKIVINKTPEGTKSPNLADGVMMKCAMMAVPLPITPGVLQRIRNMPRNRKW